MKIPANCVAIDLATGLSIDLSLQKCQSLHLSDFLQFYYSQLAIKKIKGNLVQQVKEKSKQSVCVLIQKN